MNHTEHLHLLGERSLLERLLAETPEENVLDRQSLAARLAAIREAIAQSEATQPWREPARVQLTFGGRPVLGTHGVLADFGTRAVSAFAESVTALAASLGAPLAAMGPIPNRGQHQLLITGTALGSFGFELEEYPLEQLAFDDESSMARALEHTQAVLRGTLGTDDELADSIDETDRRALDKVRAFLETLASHEAVCTVTLDESVVRFDDVGQVRRSIERLSTENVREEIEVLAGELYGVLPKARDFEFKPTDGDVIRGKIGPDILDTDALNRQLHQPTRIRVQVTRVGSGRPRYLLLAVEQAA